MSAPEVLRETSGAPWEKRGNTLWVGCPACGVQFPVGPVLARPGAAAACCPACHKEFQLAATAPRAPGGGR